MSGPGGTSPRSAKSSLMCHLSFISQNYSLPPLPAQLMSKDYIWCPRVKAAMQALLLTATAFKNDANISLAIWHSNSAGILYEYLEPSPLQ